MNASRTGKRKYVCKVRRVTACSECHRRKQKCNRQRPCTGCLSRGRPEKCLYDTIVSPQQLESPVSPPSTDLSFSGEQNKIDNSSSAIENGIGYVDLDDTGMFPVSQKLNRAIPKSSSELNSKLSCLIDQLPSPSVTQKLVNIFFNEANWYFSVLDRCFFDDRQRIYWIWYNSDPREDARHEICYFAALLLQVLSIAMQFLSETDMLDSSILSFVQPTPDDKSKACSEAGESILTLLKRRHPDLSSIEADIMRCAWLKNYGHGIDAWHSLSNAVRQAQDLRLYLEPALSVKEADTAEHYQKIWHNEHKRRIWACLLTWEAHMCLQLGRPRIINVSDCTVRRPTNCDAPNDTARTLLRESTSPLEVPSHYTSHIVKYELALMIHRAMNAGMLRPGYQSIGDIHAMHFEVGVLLSELPPAFKHPGPDLSWDIIYSDIPKLRLQIRIVAESFFLAIHRPHIFTDSLSLYSAIRSAKNVLDLSQSLFELVEENQHKTFTLVFYTIDSGLFLAITLAKVSSPQVIRGFSRDELITTLQQAISRLKFLQKFHTVATAGMEALRFCLDRLNGQQETTSMLEPTRAAVINPGTTVEMDTDMTYRFDEDEEFWANLLNDSSFTATWLDDQFDLSAPDLTLFSDNMSSV